MRKYVSETIEILTDIAKDVQLLGQAQVSLQTQRATSMPSYIWITFTCAHILTFTS